MYVAADLKRRVRWQNPALEASSRGGLIDFCLEDDTSEVSRGGLHFSNGFAFP